MDGATPSDLIGQLVSYGGLGILCLVLYQSWQQEKADRKELQKERDRDWRYFLERKDRDEERSSALVFERQTEITKRFPRPDVEDYDPDDPRPVTEKRRSM